jgi:hypothetical protein
MEANIIIYIVFILQPLLSMINVIIQTRKAEVG